MEAGVDAGGLLGVTDGRSSDEALWTEVARALLAGLILRTATSPRPELRTCRRCGHR